MYPISKKKINPKEDEKKQHKMQLQARYHAKVLKKVDSVPQESTKDWQHLFKQEKKKRKEVEKRLHALQKQQKQNKAIKQQQHIKERKMKLLQHQKQQAIQQEVVFLRNEKAFAQKELAHWKSKYEKKEKYQQQMNQNEIHQKWQKTVHQNQKLRQENGRLKRELDRFKQQEKVQRSLVLVEEDAQKNKEIQLLKERLSVFENEPTHYMHEKGRLRKEIKQLKETVRLLKERNAASSPAYITERFPVENKGNRSEQNQLTTHDKEGASVLFQSSEDIPTTYATPPHPTMKQPVHQTEEKPIKKKVSVPKEFISYIGNQTVLLIGSQRLSSYKKTLADCGINVLVHNPFEESEQRIAHKVNRSDVVVVFKQHIPHSVLEHVKKDVEKVEFIVRDNEEKLIARVRYNLIKQGLLDKQEYLPNQSTDDFKNNDTRHTQIGMSF